MTDMLVNLRRVEEDRALENKLKDDGIKIIRALAPDRAGVLAWVKKNSTAYAASECAVAFAQTPIACFIAVQNKQIIGYACYDATAPNFFGPTHVAQSQRGRGIGTVLLTKSLMAMHNEGFQYAIIGGVGPIEFYQKTVQATVIENEGASLYDDFYKFPTEQE